MGDISMYIGAVKDVSFDVNKNAHKLTNYSNYMTVYLLFNSMNNKFTYLHINNCKPFWYQLSNSLNFNWNCSCEVNRTLAAPLGENFVVIPVLPSKTGLHCCSLVFCVCSHWSQQARDFCQNSLLIHGKGEAPETQEQCVNIFFTHATGVGSVCTVILFQLIEVIGFKCWVMFLRKGVNGVSCIWIFNSFYTLKIHLYIIC